MNVEKSTDCAYCGKPIDPERLEVLVTDKCAACARKYPEPRRHDPNVVCAKSSASARNGFAPGD